MVTAEVKRLAQGDARYGKPDRSKQYVKRMKLELKAYIATGNREHLINLRNYAFLETQAPENRKYHWDSSVGSVTRGKI